MATKKQEAEERPKGQTADGRRVASLKMNREFAEYADKVAAKKRMTLAQLMEWGIVRAGEELGLGEAPKRTDR